jgi:diacylglycerol kinase family enzyme
MRFRNIHVIVNPVSGQSPVDIDMIRSKLEASESAFRIVLTEPDTGPEILARRAVEEGADLVMAAGGDGTVLGAAEGLIGTGVPLGVIPEGTANVFAAELGIPYDSGAALDLVLGDECEVKRSTSDQSREAFSAEVGITEVAMTVETDPDLKKRFRRARLPWTAFDLGRRSPILYELELDGRKSG